MLSLRARCICYALQWAKFKRRNEVIDWNTYEAVQIFRQRVEDGASKFGKLPEGIETSPLSIGNMPAEWIYPSAATRNKVILYFHGGGYVSGTIEAHRSIVAKFVNASGIPALLFEYRLAPEHRFPAALDDALTAYKWMLDQGISAQDIVFIGDSAGGGLGLATLLAVRDQGFPLPAAAVTLSPVTDFTCSGASYRTNARKCLAPEGTGPAFARHYAGDQDLSLPYISPLFGNLSGLPPLLIYACGNETLLDDSTRFAAKAKAAGVDVTLRVGEGLFHCYPAMAPMFPEATRAMNEIRDFINAHLNKQHWQ